MRQLSICFAFLDVFLWTLLQPRPVRKLNGLGSAPFDRLYSGYRCFFLFLRVLRCFSSPRSPHVSHGDRPSACRVAPFGHIRINVCLRLPVHFRSLPRPSSPPEAQASPVRSYPLSLVNHGPLSETSRSQRLSATCLVLPVKLQFLFATRFDSRF